MTRTDMKTPPANPHKHDHGLEQVDAALAGKAAATHTHPEAPHTHPEIAALEARVAALETPVPPVDPPPVTPPVTVTVRSINELYSALGNNEADITLTPGTYSGTIHFDSRFAARTKPAIVRFAGVTLNGGGFDFRGGAHHIEVLDPMFANWTLNQTGVLCFGGWIEPAVHHITVRRPKILASVHRTMEDHTTEHAAYFSHAAGGVHDILVEDMDVDATHPMGLSTAIHGDHGDPTQTGWNIIARRTVFKGNGAQGSSVQQALILWTPTYKHWLFDGATITNANGNAIRFESKGASDIVFKDIVSTGSRYPAFSSSMGANPPGVTFDSCSLQ